MQRNTQQPKSEFTLADQIALDFYTLLYELLNDPMRLDKEVRGTEKIKRNDIPIGMIAADKERIFNDQGKLTKGRLGDTWITSHSYWVDSRSVTFSPTHLHLATREATLFDTAISATIFMLEKKYVDHLTKRLSKLQSAISIDEDKITLVLKEMEKIRDIFAKIAKPPNEKWSDKVGFNKASSLNPEDGLRPNANLQMEVYDKAAEVVCRKLLIEIENLIARNTIEGLQIPDNINVKDLNLSNIPFFLEHLHIIISNIDNIKFIPEVTIESATLLAQNISSYLIPIIKNDNFTGKIEDLNKIQRLIDKIDKAKNESTLKQKNSNLFIGVDQLCSNFKKNLKSNPVYQQEQAKLFLNSAEEYIEKKEWKVGFQFFGRKRVISGGKQVPENVWKQWNIIQEIKNNKSSLIDYDKAKTTFLNIGKEKESSIFSCKKSNKYFGLFKSETNNEIENNLQQKFERLRNKPVNQ